MSNPLAGGHAGESPYRYDPAARLSLTMRYSRDPVYDSRYPWWLPPRDRQVQQMIDAAEALQLARVLYLAQRRQALAAIIGGLLVMILVIFSELI